MFRKVLGKKGKSKSKEDDDMAEGSLKGGTKQQKQPGKKKTKKSKDGNGSADSSDEFFHSEEDDSIQGSSHSQDYDPEGEHKHAPENGDSEGLFSTESKPKKKKEKKKTKATKDSSTPRKKKKKDVKAESAGKDLGAKLGLLEEARRMDTQNADEVSLRSGVSARSRASTKTTKSKKKKKKSSDSGDDMSVSSKKSKRGGKRSADKDASKRKNRSIDLQSTDIGDKELPDRTTAAYSTAGDDDLDVAAENEALQAETVTLRKQLNEVIDELEGLKAEQSQHRGSGEVTQMQIEMKRSQNEVTDLKSEVEEYEEAVVEKDGLIKKLTEAVDCQLDKVEYLELKLQRAEEEFCKMEDEMKDMEEEIETLRLSSSERLSKYDASADGEGEASDAVDLNDSIKSDGSDKDSPDHIRHQLFEDQKLLDQRDLDLQHREDMLYDREQALLDREDELRVREQELVENGGINFGDELDQIRIKELHLQEHEREVLELEDDLALKRQGLEERERRLEEMGKELERKAREQDDISIGDSIQDSPQKTQNLESPNHAIELMKNKIEELSREKEEIQRKWIEHDHEDADMKEMVEELKHRVKTYQVEIAEVREASQKADEQWNLRESEQQAQRDLELQTIQEGINKQLKELDAENRRLKTECSVLKEQHETLKDSIPDEGIDPKDHAMAALQDEIASLREKIVVKEREHKVTREEINRIVSENEEHRIEVNDLETELVSLATQLRESKDSSSKKMEQKDETIAFMQKEIVRLMKEKQALDKKVREKKLGRNDAGFLEKHSGHKKVMEQRDEAEMAQVQAFRDQLAALDAENNTLREKEAEMKEEIEKSRYEYAVEIKEKDGRILQIEEELADLNWEMKARKEADYVSLLKDRKERKKELEATKKKVQKANEVKADLERELQQMKQNQQDLENDVAELNKSLVSRDSGDYVSGLKRQIRSLKEHNMALERKLEIEALAAHAKLGKKEERISILEKEVQELKNPAQAAVRGMFSFGKSLTGGGLRDSQHSVSRTSDVEGKDEKDPMDTSRRQARHSSHGKMSPLKAPPTPGRTSALWNAIISPFGGSKRQVPRSTMLELDPEPVESQIAAGNEGEDKKDEPKEDDIKEEEDVDDENDEEEDPAEDEANKSEPAATLGSVAESEQKPEEAPEEDVSNEDDEEETLVTDEEYGTLEEEEEGNGQEGEADHEEEEEVKDGDESLETAEDIDTDDDVDLTPDTDDEEGGGDDDDEEEEETAQEEGLPDDNPDAKDATNGSREEESSAGMVADDIDSQHPFPAEEAEAGTDTKTKPVVFV